MKFLYLAFILLVSASSYSQENKQLDKENKEDIRQDAETKLELLDKKIDSLRVKLNKDVSDEKIQLQQAMSMRKCSSFHILATETNWKSFI